MPELNKKNPNVERKYEHALDFRQQVNIDDFMTNNEVRAANTAQLQKHPNACSYDINDLLRATATSEGNYDAARVPTYAKKIYDTVTQTSSYSATYSSAISDDPFSTLYRFKTGSVTLMSIGDLYISTNDNKCGQPILAFPQESTSNHGACNLDLNTYSVYSQLSKKYLNRYAKIWLGIWPGEQGNYKFNGKKYRVLGPYDRFLLEAVNEPRSERYQISVPTAPDWPEIVYFFGRNPVVIGLQFMLFNTLTHNWTEQFLQLYETTLRGTKLVEHKTTIYIGFEDVLYGGYLLNLSIGRTATNSDALPVNMSMLITRRNTLHVPLVYNGQSVLDTNFMKMYPELAEQARSQITAMSQQEANSTGSEIHTNVQSRLNEVSLEH